MAISLPIFGQCPRAADVERFERAVLVRVRHTPSHTAPARTANGKERSRNGNILFAYSQSGRTLVGRKARCSSSGGEIDERLVLVARAYCQLGVRSVVERAIIRSDRVGRYGHTAWDSAHGIDYGGGSAIFYAVKCVIAVYRTISVAGESAVI